MYIMFSEKAYTVFLVEASQSFNFCIPAVFCFLTGGSTLVGGVVCLLVSFFDGLLSCFTSPASM